MTAAMYSTMYRPTHFQSKQSCPAKEFPKDSEEVSRKNIGAKNEDAVWDLMASHPFVTLITSGVASESPSGSQQERDLQVNHYPVWVDRRAGVIRGHLALANPQQKHLQAGGEVLVIFHGPHAYVSPAWYGPGVQVPTWNYAVVHAYGDPRVIREKEPLLSQMREQVEHFEAGQPSPWVLDLPEPDRTEMLSAIVGFEIRITRLEPKWKLSQNRTDEEARGVIDALSRSGSETDRRVGRLMREARGWEK